MARLTRAEMRGRAQTAKGLVEPASPGSTLMHKHLIWDIRLPAKRSGEQGPEPRLANHWGMSTSTAASPANAHQPSVEVAVEPVAEAVAQGCETIVELTIGGLSPDPEGLVKVSEAAGCRIVMGCGHSVEEYRSRRTTAAPWTTSPPRWWPRSSRACWAPRCAPV